MEGNGRKTAGYIILSTFAACWTGTFLVSVFMAFKGLFHVWVFTDWLIDYAGGFVRRGLAGAILNYLALHLEFDVRTAVIIFSHALYLIVAILYLARVLHAKNRLDGVSLSILLFLPALLFFPLLDFGAMGRKEILFMMPLLLNLAFLDTFARDHTKKYLVLNAVFFNLAAIPIALTHEAIIFLTIPISAMITWKAVSSKYSTIKSIQSTVLTYIPTVIAVFLCMIHRGDLSFVRKIDDSWRSLGVTACGDSYSSVKALSWNVDKALGMSAHLVTADYGLQFGLWCVLFLVYAVFLYIVSTRLMDSRHAGSLLLYCLIIPTLCAIPLFVLGWDWGRWIFIILLNYALCFLSPELVRIELEQPSDARTMGAILSQTRLGSGYETFCGIIARLPQTYGLAWKIGVIYVLLFTSLPHCCIEPENLYTGLLKHLVVVSGWVMG